jgi:hypothetical protein
MRVVVHDGESSSVEVASVRNRRGVGVKVGARKKRSYSLAIDLAQVVVAVGVWPVDVLHRRRRRRWRRGRQRNRASATRHVRARSRVHGNMSAGVLEGVNARVRGLVVEYVFNSRATAPLVVVVVGHGRPPRVVSAVWSERAVCPRPLPVWTASATLLVGRRKLGARRVDVSLRRTPRVGVRPIEVRVAVAVVRSLVPGVQIPHTIALRRVG